MKHRRCRFSECLPTTDNMYVSHLFPSLLLSFLAHTHTPSLALCLCSLRTRSTMARRTEFVHRRRARCSAKELREMLGSVPGLRPLQKWSLSAELHRFLRSHTAAPLLRVGSEEAMGDLVFHFLTDHGEDFWVFDHETGGYDHMYGEYVFPNLSP